MSSPLPATSAAYRKYVLVVLMAVYAFNFIDRQILVVLQESVKKELSLSDTQLGLLTGFGFAMFYVTLGIPLAKVADRSNRRNMVAICLTLWSGVTALTGMAANFFQLLLARIGVGIGEAGCSPPSHAIITDYFPEGKRATALSVYNLGIYVGIFIGYLGGGILNQSLGWRATFLWMGLPGVLLALVLYFTVKEPMRGSSDAQPSDASGTSYKQVLSNLLSSRAFVFLSLASGFNAFAQYALGNWMPSFFFRFHGMNSQQIGVSNALIVGLGGAIGTFGGGFLCDRLARKSQTWYLRVPMLSVLVSLPLTMILLFTSTTWATMTAAFISTILTATYLAPCVAVSHQLVPANQRALTSSVLLFILNIIGLGGGPVFVGMLSDLFQSSAGDQSLRYAMAVSAASVIVAGILYYLGSRELTRKT